MFRTRWPTLPCLLIAAQLITLSSAAFDPGERDALLAFIGAADPENVLQGMWNDSSEICSWPGLNCTNDNNPGRVTRLLLEEKKLSGYIPEGTLGRLTELRKLSLANNSLQGSIPADLSGCTNLKKIYLHGNNLAGTIPVSFQQLGRLDTLSLSRNSLEGQIPAALGSHQKMLTLMLDHNALTGPIPDFGFPNLRNFSVSYNKLSGPIPKSLQTMGPAAFAGNLELCGAPVDKICPASKHKSMAGTLVAIIAISVGICLLFVAGIMYRCRKQDVVPAGETPAGKALDKARQSVDIESISKQFHDVTTDADAGTLFFTDAKYNKFDLKDLLRASAELLGKGNGGTTYKAAIGDGMVVAVKRLLDRSSTERRDFEQQMDTIGKTKHPNLLPLMAYYYYAKEEKLLVYDYLPNKNLYTRLHGNRSTANRVPLCWLDRLKAAHGVAQGLKFLHERMPHGNIKSTNIIFDASNTPCIADFGLFPYTVVAQLAQRDGYAAPELIASKKASQKGDVYSFGVVLLELLTGRVAATQGSKIDLPRWVNSVVREEWTAEVFDYELVSYRRNIEEEMVYLLRIAMDCVSPTPEQRPKMTQVVKMIEDIIEARGSSPSQSFSSDLQSSIHQDKSVSTSEEESVELRA